VKEKFQVLIYQATLMTGGLVILKLLTNLLTAEDFGRYSLVLSVAALVTGLPFNSVTQGIIRYFSIYKSKKRPGQLMYVGYSIFIVSSAFYLIALIIFSLTTSYRIESALFLYCFLISEAAKLYLRGVVNADRQRLKLAISAIIEFGAKIFIVIVLHFILDLKFELVLTVFLLANLASIAPLINERSICWDKPSSFAKKIIFKRLFYFSTPLIVWSIFGWARDMSNRWYLETFVDTESVAIFTVLTSVAMIFPTVIQSLFNSYNIPILYQLENQESGAVARFMNKFSCAYIIVSIVFTILLIFFGAHVMKIFTSGMYSAYAPLLPWMALSYSMYILSSIVAIEVFAAKKTYYLLAPNILPGIVSVIVGYILIRKYGFDGAIASYIVTYSSFSVLMFATIFIFRRRAPATK